MTQNFNNAKIYKITNDYNDEVYVGSTCDTLTKRYSAHKSMSKDEKHINSPIYKLMNEIGVERFRIDLIEDYPCNDKQALRQRVGFFIREQGTLNKQIAGRTQKEYEEQNKDKIKERIKEYHIVNKDIIKEKRKSYYEANKEKIKEYQKEYHKKKLENNNIAVN